MLSEHCRIYHPDFLCIAEPFIPFSSVRSSFWQSLGFSFLVENQRECGLPSLWIFYASRLPVPIVSLVNEQFVSIESVLDSTPIILCFIYASVFPYYQRRLWTNLEHVCSSGFLVLAIGDFNAILGSHESLGGNIPNRRSCEDFANMISSCDFVDIDSTGSSFTWANGRGVRSHVEHRLD